MEPIVESTPGERAAALRSFIGTIKQLTKQRREFAISARPALDTLVAAMAHRSGQSYHIRALLHSLYTGTPADLSRILHLDFELRNAVGAVILGFGYEDSEVQFFYAAVREALDAANLGEWFFEEASE